MDPPQIDTLTVSQEQWTKAFMEGPHTSFGMVKVLMKELRLDFPKLLEKPEELSEAFKDRKPLIYNIEDRPWVNTWAGETGRCTSFAVKVARALERAHPSVFKFMYFDLGRHRVARCARTNILINSDSDTGAKIMLPSAHDTDWTERDRRGRYKFRVEGYSIYEGKEPLEPGVERRSRRDPVSPEEAMSVCLQEVAQNMVFICCFRSLEDGKPKYLSLIRWNIEKKRIELTPNVNRRDQIYCITFDRERGNQASEKECVENLVEFIREYGTPHQWLVEDVYYTNQALWEAAVHKWGKPVWSAEGLVSQLLGTLPT
ncbi:hypothetical protein MFIFM68171_02641 [Madurella fahalii]|uniref:Transglutaminase-like domain-containing protein n=1 Tax=Madurella fahalii TaxID=1157608 RepID=A0ABQ0G3X0_9PEZI